MEQGKFTEMVDELLLVECDKDPELKESMAWLDGEARRLGLDYYDMICKIVLDNEASKNAKEWLSKK